jgi:LPS sulfotransferase NodH
VRWVYLVRRDLAAQAVSLAYARQTGQWTSLHARSGKVAYDRSRIDRCLQELQRQNAGWDAVFAQAGMRPLRVEFEALIAEQDAVVAQVAAWLGIDATVPSLVQVPATEPQAEPEKAEWLARYRAETAAA